MTRRHISMRVKLKAALLQLGLNPATAELDHEPALRLRAHRDGDYWPEELDPKYMVWRDRKSHAHKTNVDNGTGRSDKGAIAHSDRIREKQEKHLCRMATPKSERRPSKRSRWPSKPFPKRPSK